MFRDAVSSNPFIAMSKGGGKSPQPQFVDPMLTVSSPDVMAAFFAQQLAQHAANSAMPVVGGNTPSGPQVVRRGPGGGLSLPFPATGTNSNSNTAQRQRTNVSEDSGVSGATQSAPAVTLDYRTAAAGSGPKATQSFAKPPGFHQGPNQSHAPLHPQHHHHHHPGGATTMPPSPLSALEKEELLARTIHLRFLPTGMKQGELAAMCAECGPVLRVRICGGQNHNNHNWIYGFVEFASTAAAHRMMRKSGMELYNGPLKPSLRLKCHIAREPIVDRVFHDADPARGVLCQFGHGAFAQRTLGEALDSYFSLVNKSGGAQTLKEELQQQQQQQQQKQQQQPPRDKTAPHKTSQQHSAIAALTSGAGGEVDSAGGGSLSGIAWSQLPLSPEVMVGGNHSSLSVESSATSSVNGRTSSNPPSPQPAQHGAIGTPTTTAASSSAAGGCAVGPLVGGGGSGAAATTFSLPPSLAGPHPSVSTPTSQHDPRSGFHRDSCHAVVNKCLTLLDTAMRTGAEFAASGNVTKFYDAMHPLQALHETIHAAHQAKQENASTAAANGNGSGTTSPGRSLTEYSIAAAAAAGEAAAAQSDEVRFENDIRCIRISAFLIASFLHILRGSLSDMLPCITRALDIIAEVSMAAVPKPANLELGHEDDEEAFLSALSLVHVVQPAALVSREMHRNEVRHQEFLCNALMALGFGVEDLNSLIARCAYTGARRRAHSALGLSNAVLDQALSRGGVHNLRFSLGGLPSDIVLLSSKKAAADAAITSAGAVVQGGTAPSSSSFVFRFFDSYGTAVAKSSLTRSPGGASPPLQHQPQANLAMDELPPLHCARVFSQRTG